jgi:hypothetical protein
MNLDLIFDGLDPFTDLTEIVERMAGSTALQRVAMIDALGSALHRAGLQRQDANAIAYNVGEIARRMRRDLEIEKFVEREAA